MVTQGHISHNLFVIGNSSGTAPNAIHLDADGGGSGPRVAGLHLIGNVFEGLASSMHPGAAIHIANGASDITILGGRANFEANAIEIVGTAGTMDGITVVGFGANSPINGYNSGSSSANQTGIAIIPSAGMAVQNVTLTGCNLSQCTKQGLLIGLPTGGGSISGVSAVGNSFWGYASPAVPVTIAGGTNAQLHIATNPGYNPVGYTISAPPIAATTAGSVFANSFPQTARIFIVSPSGSITGVSITAAAVGSVAVPTGLKVTSSGVLIELGVGESITLFGSLGTPASQWTWFLE
jgi:hypothetical protein